MMAEDYGKKILNILYFSRPSLVENLSYLYWYFSEQSCVVSLYLHIAAAQVDLDDINILLSCDIFQALPSQDVLVDGEMVHKFLKLISGDVAGQLS